MRISTINVIMFGIGLCDVCTMGFLIYLIMNYITVDECTPAPSYTLKIIELVNGFCMDITRRLVAWFGILMSSLRFFIIKNALKPGFSNYSDLNFFLKTMVVLFFISTLMSAYYFFRKPIVEIDLWEPPEDCVEFPGGYTRVQYESAADYWGTPDLSWSLRVFNLTDGILRLIPTFAFPTFTFLLLKKLREAEHSRRRTSLSKSNEQKEHTVTKLVIIMTCTFMLAEGPYGVVFFFQSIVVEPPGVVYISFDIADMLGILKVLNAWTHCLICLKISTQYRNTVKSLFGCKEAVRNVVTVSSMTRSSV